MFLQLPNLDLQILGTTVIVDDNKIIVPAYEIIIYSNGYAKIMNETVKVIKHNIPV